MRSVGGHWATASVLATVQSDACRSCERPMALQPGTPSPHLTDSPPISRCAATTEPRHRLRALIDSSSLMPYTGSSTAGEQCSRPPTGALVGNALPADTRQEAPTRLSRRKQSPPAWPRWATAMGCARPGSKLPRWAATVSYTHLTL